MHIILHYFMYSCIISQFLDKSSNLKAGCKKDVVHDAFDTIYVSYIDNHSRNFYVLFSPSSGTGFCRILATSLHSNFQIIWYSQLHGVILTTVYLDV